MAVFNKQGLLTELLDRIELVKASTQPFLRLNNDQLNYKPAPDKWSIAQVFEHLNISQDIYIRSILSRIAKAPDIARTERYNSSWLGDWVYERIMPRTDGSVFKLKTPKSLQAAAAELDGHDVLHRFLQQLDMLDDILHHCGTKNLERIRIPFSFVSLLKLRLGDNLRFLVAHCERHLLQAHKAVPGLPDSLVKDLV